MMTMMMFLNLSSRLAFVLMLDSFATIYVVFLFRTLGAFNGIQYAKL